MGCRGPPRQPHETPRAAKLAIRARLEKHGQLTKLGHLTRTRHRPSFRGYSLERRTRKLGGLIHKDALGREKKSLGRGFYGDVKRLSSGLSCFSRKCRIFTECGLAGTFPLGRLAKNIRV